MPKAEALETRRLPSALLTTPPAASAPGPASPTISLPLPIPFLNLSPAQIRQAYGIDALSFGPGTPKADGSGETIALVDAFNDPNIAADLGVFDAFYHIAPPPRLTVVDQNGPGAALPRSDATWALETSLDVEWAHAIAPGANLLLVEANSENLSDLMAAVRYAAAQPGVASVSMSWGFYEFATETLNDGNFTAPGVTFVAASGDDGGLFGPLWPSTSPSVLSVGGTALSTSIFGRTGESAWSFSLLGYLLGVGAGGGGVSRFEPAPPAQQAALSGLYPKRAAPDVAYDASPLTGVPVYDSVPYLGISGWIPSGGTSAGAPQWAALLAIADQGRRLNHLPSLGSADTLRLLYGLAPTLGGSRPSPYFNDITSGHIAYYSAQPGYDLATGLGTPIASALVPYLASARATSPASPVVSPSATPALAGWGADIPAMSLLVGMPGTARPAITIGLPGREARAFLVDTSLSGRHHAWRATAGHAAPPRVRPAQHSPHD